MLYSNPSSLKILESNWQTCENCSLMFPVTAYQRHQENCQGQKMVQEIISSSQDGCIANNILYATVVPIKKTDFPVTLKKEKKPVVLIHPSTMMLFKFRNGGPVLVHSSHDECVCRSWACTAIGVDCVAFPDISCFKWNLCDKVSLHLCRKGSDVAAKLYLTTEHVEEYMSSKQFKAVVLRELDHMFIREGSTVSINYLGALCEFSVLKILGGRESISEKNRCNSVHLLKDLESSSQLDHLTESFSEITLKNKLPHVNKYKINCLLHCKPPSHTSSMLAEVEYQYDNAGNQCKVHDYFVVVPQTQLFIETSKESEMKQRITFDQIGGLEIQLKIIKVIIDDFISRHSIENYESLYTGVLLSGPSGTGKTLVAKAVADECEDSDITFITIDQSELSDSQCETNIAKVKEKFKEAVKSSPSIIFIDDIDQILPKENDRSSTSYQTKRIAAEIADMIDAVVAKPNCAVLILATANNPESINPIVMKLKRIDKEIKFDIPDSNARYKILKKLLANARHNLTEEQVKFVAESTEQYTGADLCNICSKASQYATASPPEDHSELSEPVHIRFCHFKSALKEVKPSASKEFVFNIPKDESYGSSKDLTVMNEVECAFTVQWSDIGGMHSIKEEIKEHFDSLLHHAGIWKRIGLTPAHGLLMYGPPGCAKTMLAMAVANEIKANFIPIKGPELLNKYVGESEKAIQKLFQNARCASPCIIYFDEIDSIAIQRRSHEVSSRVDVRVLSQLLVEMSGVDALEGVVILASTNRPHMIDSALLRPGRFDRKIYVPLPDSITRREILLMKLKGVPADEINFQVLIERTEGYSCAEVVALCDKAIQTYIVGKISSETKAFMPLFYELLETSVPKTSTKLLEIYVEFSRNRFNK